MFKATSVRLSALSKRTKRVRVQLLKDFPMFNLYKGQVTKVKPSLMRNYLHNFNGARYVMAESDIDMELLSRSQEREILIKEKAKDDVNNMVKDEELGGKSTEDSTEKAPLKTMKETKQNQEKPKGVLEKNITIKDVKIPGLDL